MLRYAISYFIFGLLVASCDAVSTTRNQNELISKAASQGVTTLPNEIFLLIGRGSCCNGHMVTITETGEVVYFVGSYTIASDSSEMPETYDRRSIKQNSEYKPKNRKLPHEKIKQLAQLIGDTQGLQFTDKVQVDDDYVYTLFLDNRKIATGYQSRMSEFPANLAALVDLIRIEVELYELPGMA